MGIIVRGVAWLYRFFCCLEQLGFANTFKIFLSGRLRNKEIEIKLPNDNSFFCHGRLDRVSSHFYTLGYFIETNGEQKITTIIDAGANVGVETARFQVHHPNAEIIAIEAAPRNYALLERNFKKEEKVQTILGGLWSEETVLSVISTADDMQAFQVIASSKTETSIDGFTIPQLMKKYNWDHIDILKMDIEGAEYELFSRNFESWIGKVNVFIFEVPDSDRPGTTQKIFKALEPFSFNTFHCGENLVLIKSVLPWQLKKPIGFMRKS